MEITKTGFYVLRTFDGEILQGPFREVYDAASFADGDWPDGGVEVAYINADVLD